LESFRILPGRGRSAHTCPKRDTNCLSYTDAHAYPDPHAATDKNIDPGTPNTHSLYKPDRDPDAHALPHPDAHTCHAEHHATTDAHAHIHPIDLIRFFLQRTWVYRGSDRNYQRRRLITWAI